ncbi:MAG: sodium:solute symporter family protein [Cyclobacteriaceae bacterium]|nr:sodium:solute symporter family protein [Cyclobacteriaceae bacterium]UYN88417.1 MAG: sodium:solute symporter family protein [Cyclobacteriaceae bacterium]
MLIASIILYLIGTVLISIWAAQKVKTSNDFMLAGRSLPIVLSTSALFATWFGSETIFGASSEFLKGGLFSVIEDPFGAALCLVLFGMFFARKLYAMNLLTLCDYFRYRFDRKTEFVSSIFMVPSYFGYIAAQLVALGLILNVVAGLPVWQGIVASSIVVTAYTFIGGMWAISITDFIQSIIIVVGLGVLAYILSSKAGGVLNVIQSAPVSTFKFFPEPNTVSVVSYLAAWSVLGLGSIPSQDVFQRSMSSGSASVAVRSCYYAAGLYLTVAMLPLFISLCIQFLYPESLDGDTQLTLPSMVLQHAAMPVQILFFGSLLSAIMSTTSSAMLAPAAVVTENILKPMMKNKPTDLHFLMITRLTLIAVSVIATAMACLKSNIYELVGGASILSLVSLFIPMAAGMYWKRSSSVGAVLAMMLGMAAWIYFEYYPVDIPSLVPAVMVSLFAMIVGSLLWPTKKF